MQLKIMTDSELDPITTAKVCNPNDFFSYDDSSVGEILKPFWNKIYLILVSSYGFPYVVNASCEQDAVDYLIDYLEEEENGALLMTREEEEDYRDDGYLEEYISGGNHGRYIYTHNVRILPVHQDDILAN